MPERALPISFSLLAHIALLAGLVLFWTTHPISLPPPKSIDVQVLSENDYRQATSPPPAAPAAVTSPKQSASASAPPQPATKQPPSAPAVSTTPGGMTHATTLFSTAMLREPASREVRATLPTLDRYERITQLCNIETTEQIRRALKASNPDTVSAAAFADTTLSGLTLTAPGASYRSKRNWYALRFECTVLPDLSGVADYSFSTGAAIPKDQWEEHNLNTEDEDDE